MVSASAGWAAAATLIAVAFALSTFERWWARRRRHELAWTVSLVMFAVASAALWWGAGHGWTAGTFRIFFLFGACLNVPWLALGSIELLYGERVGRWATGIVALASAFAAGVLMVAPLRGAVPPDDLPQGKDVFGALPRVFAGVFSGGGATVVVALALMSAWRVWRRGARRGVASVRLARPGRLVAGNLLIALGTLVLGASGTLNARLGAMNAFSVTLVVGIAILFAGFLVATTATGAAAAIIPRPAVPPPIAALLDEVDRELEPTR